MNKLFLAVLPLLLSVLGIQACLDDGIEPDVLPEFLFVAHKTVEGDRSVMEALYSGKVLERDGCLRLDGEESAMVVWPPGYTFAESLGRFNVKNEIGVNVGKIGEAFRFGGGFVQTLVEGGPVAEGLRQEALTKCPGTYWIVGEMYSTEEPIGN